MKQQVGVIVKSDTVDVESAKQNFREDYENVDPSVRKPEKLAFVEKSENGSSFLD